MNELKLRQLSVLDNIQVYYMLQRIGPCENEFTNTAHGLEPSDFKAWLEMQDSWSRGEQLPLGFVPQTIFWLYDGDQVVGIGKIRHSLNDNSRQIGGNIGYAIDPLYRGRGYATQLLIRLVTRARDMGIDEILLTVEKYNPASRKVIEKAGGHLIKETEERWYFEF